MIDCLYPFAKEWVKSGSLYITSDPHFGDLDMVWRCQSNSDETDEEKAEFLANHFISMMNTICQKNDTLVILGDIGNPSWLSKLKSKNIILVKGNHDLGNANYTPYVKEIYEGPVFIAPKIVLSHEPMPAGPYLNIHGHVHNEVDLGPHYINVAVDRVDFLPLNLASAIKLGALKKIDDIHRETIDRASKNAH